MNAQAPRHALLLVSTRGRRRSASEGSGQHRRDRVGLTLVAGLVVATFGCTTTHDLGRLSDPATFAALEEVTTRSDVYARVEPFPTKTPHVPGDRVQKLTHDGLLTAPIGGAPVLVPLAQVRSVSSYDHARGARTGALVLGISTFVVTAVLSTFLVVASESCNDGCGGSSHPVPLVLGLSTIAGLGGAVVGGGIGAIVGHEDRYVLARE